MGEIQNMFSLPTPIRKLFTQILEFQEYKKGKEKNKEKKNRI